MNIDAIIKKYTSYNWYRQGGAVSLYYGSLPYTHGKDWNTVLYYKEGNNYGYFDKDVQRKIAKKDLSNATLDTNWVLREKIEPWRAMKEQSEQLGKTLSLEFLRKCSDDELVAHHKAFDDLWYTTWDPAVVIEPFDPWGDILLSEALEKYGVSFTAEEFGLVTGQQSLHYGQQEHLSLYTIARAYMSDEDVDDMLQDHFNAYYWINNTWHDAAHLTVDDFRRRMLAIAELPSEEIDQNIEHITLLPEVLQRRIEEVERNIPQELQHILYFFRTLADLRDERKAWVLKSVQILDNFLCEFSNRTGIIYELLHYMHAFDVTSIEHIKSCEPLFRKRKEGCVYFFEGDELVWLFGKDAEKVHTAIEALFINKEISGTIAQKGIAHGTVCKIITREDFSKMQPGAVLVTQMTRPEFVPLMKQASAIVTDEGGLTCHAAIISRELKIPCIIGTQNATSVLNDGDSVIVDAEQGIVTLT